MQLAMFMFPRFHIFVGMEMCSCVISHLPRNLWKHAETRNE